MIYLLVVATVFIFTFILLYNRIIRDTNYVKEGWSGIDIQLKKRHDLLPKFIDAVQAYMTYEKKTLEDITRIREGSIHDGSLQDRARVENELSHGVATLLAKVENYPQLKSDAAVSDLLKNITQVEDQLQMSRRYYNGAVRNLNVRLETFPSSLIGTLFHFKPAEYFQASADDRTDSTLQI